MPRMGYAVKSRGRKENFSMSLLFLPWTLTEGWKDGSSSRLCLLLRPPTFIATVHVPSFQVFLSNDSSFLFLETLHSRTQALPSSRSHQRLSSSTVNIYGKASGLLCHCTGMLSS